MQSVPVWSSLFWNFFSKKICEIVIIYTNTIDILTVFYIIYVESKQSLNSKYIFIATLLGIFFKLIFLKNNKKTQIKWGAT